MPGQEAQEDQQPSISTAAVHSNYPLFPWAYDWGSICFMKRLYISSGPSIPYSTSFHTDILE